MRDGGERDGCWGISVGYSPAKKILPLSLPPPPPPTKKEERKRHIFKTFLCLPFSSESCKIMMSWEEETMHLRMWIACPSFSYHLWNFVVSKKYVMTLVFLPNYKVVLLRNLNVFIYKWNFGHIIKRHLLRPRKVCVALVSCMIVLYVCLPVVIILCPLNYSETLWNCFTKLGTKTKHYQTACRE